MIKSEVQRDKKAKSPRPERRQCTRSSGSPGALAFSTIPSISELCFFFYATNSCIFNLFLLCIQTCFLPQPTFNTTVVPTYPQTICTKTPSGCLKLQGVPILYTLFFSYTYTRGLMNEFVHRWGSSWLAPIRIGEAIRSGYSGGRGSVGN